MIKKTILCLSLCLVVAACGQEPNTMQTLSSNLPDSGSAGSNGVSVYSPEELLGKTVEEYQLLEDDKKAEGVDAVKKIPSIIKNGYLQLQWENLIAPGFDANSILDRYEPLIAKLEHGGEGAVELYQKMQDEFDNAPANESLSGKKVSIPGFIAPLEQQDGIITEFLLVPYFGACIHSPAPPANQTVYVKVARDYGIKIDDSYDPIWVSGALLIENESTDIGAASYQVHDAVISAYSQEP